MVDYTAIYEIPKFCPICNSKDYLNPSNEQRKRFHIGNRKILYRGEKFICHLENIHKKEFYEYLIELGFKLPKCSCGCGNYTKYRMTSKILFHKYLKRHGMWNKGKTKENNESIKRYAESRSGKNHWFYGKSSPTKGLKFSEETKQKMSLFQSNRKIQPMKGKHHSKENCEKFRRNAINQILVGQRGKTSIEIKFEEFLIDVGLDYKYQKHIYPFVYDFEVETEFGIILVEVNGDYWHANPEFFKIREKEEILDDVQKRNVLRDKKKIELTYKLTGYLGLIILWENEINNLNFRRLFWKRLVKLYLSKELEKSNV